MGSSALEEAVRSGSAGERGRIWTRSVKPQAAWDPQRRLAASVYEAWGCEAWGCVRGAWSLAWRPALAPALGGGPGNLAPGIWRLAGADWPGQADERGA